MQLPRLHLALGLLIGPLALPFAPASAQVAVASAAEALPSVTLPPELDRTLRDYERAWRAADASALSMLFVEDGFVLQSSRAPVRGRAAIQRAYASGAGGALALRALAYGTEGPLGYIIGAYGFGDGGADVGKYILILRRGADGRWLIVSDMDNLSSAPRRATPARVLPPAP